MPTYTFVNMGPSEGQLSDLLKKKKILLSKDDLIGEVAVPLTKALLTRYKSVLESGRSMRLQLSGTAITAMRSAGVIGESTDEADRDGEGWFSDAVDKAKDLAKAGLKAGVHAGLPLARMGAAKLLDKAQAAAQKQTGRLGMAAPVGEAAVDGARWLADKGVNKLEDKIRATFGGAAGRKAIDAHHGAGFFDEYLLPAVKTAAQIGIPMLTGRGVGGKAKMRAAMKKACNAQMGEGWFDDYFLPSVKTAADIALPLLRGGGFWDSLGMGVAPKKTGWGWFSDYVLPSVKTAADIGIPLLRGRGTMAQKKSTRRECISRSAEQH